MRKKYIIASLVLSGWYALITAFAQWGTLEARLHGAAYAAYKIVFELFMPDEAFGVCVLLFLPIALLIFAAVLTAKSKSVNRWLRLLYFLPPFLLGVPAAATLFCVAVHWSPFDMELFLSMVYNFAISAVWFLVCLYLLLRNPRKSAQKPLAK